MIRTEAQLTVSTLCELIDPPRRTDYSWQTKSLAGLAAKGPRPSPVLDVIEPDVAKTAEDDRLACRAGQTRR